MAAKDTAPTADAETGEIDEVQAESLILEAFSGAGLVKPDADDPMAIQMQIVNRILAAESMDALFGQFEAKTIDKYEGEVVTISDAEWGTFESEQGTIPLARLQIATIAAPTPVLVIATSPNLTAFVARAQQLGGLPFTAKIIGNKTKRGFTALHFERA